MCLVAKSAGQKLTRMGKNLMQNKHFAYIWNMETIDTADFE